MTSPLERYLIEDHARLDTLLRKSIADEQHFDTEPFEQFRAGLLRHIGIEEKQLLVHARQKRNGDPLPLAAILRVEHAALGSLMVPTPDRALVHEIMSLLEQHNVREEEAQGLYAQCAVLAGGDAAAVLEKMRAISAPPVARHFDGSGVHRTAAEALSSAQRAARPKALKELK